MAETVPGGRYLGTDGKTWHDANGKQLDARGMPVEPVAPAAAELSEEERRAVPRKK